MKLEKSSRSVETMADAAVAQDCVFKLAVPARLRGDNKKGQITYVHDLLKRRAGLLVCAVCPSGSGMRSVIGWSISGSCLPKRAS